MLCEKCGVTIRYDKVVHNTNLNETYRRKCCKGCGAIMFTCEFEVDYDEQFKKQWNKCDEMRRKKRRKETK